MVILMGVFGFLLSLFGIYGLWELWSSNPLRYEIEIALKITGYGAALVVGSSIAIYCVNKWAKNQTRTALQKNYSSQPWRWRFDWFNGYSNQNMTSLYLGLVFSFSWTVLLIPIIISKADELPRLFFWIFAVGFPTVSAMLLLQQISRWLRYFLYARSTLKFNKLPFKQGKTGSVVLTGKSVKLRQFLTARMKVMFKYVSKTKDSGGTTYRHEETELAGIDWRISDIGTMNGKSLKLSGSIPNGYPDFGKKIIYPEYSDSEGTICYKLFIQSNDFIKKVDINFDLPVFSSIPQYQGRKYSGYVIDDSCLASSVAMVLAVVLTLAIYDANQLRYSADSSTSFGSELNGFVGKKYLADKSELVLSAKQLNSVDGMNGATRFMRIVRYEDVEQTKKAVNRGANLYIKDDFGRIAIHHAVTCHPNQKEGRTEQVLEYLLSLDNDMIRAKDSNSRSPLYWAIDSSCLEGVNALLARGSIVTTKLIEAAKRERNRLHSRDNFVREAVTNSEHIVEILQSI